MTLFLILHAVKIGAFVAVILAVFIGLKTKRKWLKHLCYNSAAIFICLFSVEIYFSYFLHPAKELLVSDEGKPFKTEGFKADRNELLGYGLNTKKKYIDVINRYKSSEKVIYNTRYTFKEGLRYTGNNNMKSDESVFFLGGSFTFGLGVNDNETLPYYFNQYQKGKYAIKNYGYSGYGTHQVCAIVHNLLEKDSLFIHSSKKQVYYLFILPHIMRSAGYSFWDFDGPYYTLEKNQLKYKGSFKNQNSFQKLKRYVKTAIMWSAIFQKYGRHYFISENNKKLSLRMIAEIDKTLKDKDTEFTVILDDLLSKKSTIKKELIYYFESNHISYIDILDVIPDIEDNFDKYYIAGDGHPTALHNQLLAKYLADHSL